MVRFVHIGFLLSLLSFSAYASWEDNQYYRLEHLIEVEGHSYNGLHFEKIYGSKHSADEVYFGLIDAEGRWTEGPIKRPFTEEVKPGHNLLENVREEKTRTIMAESGSKMDFDGNTLIVYPEKTMVRAERMLPTQNYRPVLKEIKRYSERKSLKVLVLEEPVMILGRPFNTFHFEEINPEYSGLFTQYDYKVRLSNSTSPVDGLFRVLEPTFTELAGVRVGFPLTGSVAVKAAPNEPVLIFDYQSAELPNKVRISGINFEYKRELLPGRNASSIVLKPFCDVILSDGL